MASILNYTKTFRIKNQIINIINRHNGYTVSAKEEIKSYFSKSSLYGECTLLEGNNDFGSNSETRCEIKEYSDTNAAGGSYYKVRLYVTFQFPLIKRTMQIPITGETKTLHVDKDNGKLEDEFKLIDNLPSIGNDNLTPDNSVCMPGSPPPSIPACCSPAICKKGEIRSVNGSCGCYSTSNGSYVQSTTYNQSSPGRRRCDSGCCYCYDCDESVSLGVVTGDGSSELTGDSNIYIEIIDPGYVGITICKASVNGLVDDGLTKRISIRESVKSVVYNAARKCIGQFTISCSDGLGHTKTKTINDLSKPLNCKTCNYTEKKCTLCEDGYYLENGECKECEHCDTCTNNGCTKCSAGYYLVGNKCEQCSSNCSVCTATNDNNTRCKICNAGYGKPYNGAEACVECYIDHCTSCNADYKKCSGCEDGYTLKDGSCVFNGKCVKCFNRNGGYYWWNWHYTDDTLGATCAIDSNYTTDAACTGNTNCGGITGCYRCGSNSGGNCLECNSGYTKSNGNCTKISCSNISNCSLCSRNSSGSCITCNAGYYKNNSGNCSKCSTGCSTCTSSTVCTACNAGYYKSGNSCLSCPTGCSTCTSSTVCTACKAGYYKSGNSCPSCSTGCKACTSSNNCTTCDSGYHKDSTGKACEVDQTCTGLRPKNCDENCIICDGTNGKYKCMQQCYQN